MKMFSVSRVLFSTSASFMRLSSRPVSKLVPTGGSKNATDQMEYLKSVTESKVSDWASVKNNLLNIPGSLNEKNIDGVIMRVLVNNKNYDTALSFGNHIKSTGDMNVGSINGLLNLYYELGLQNKLSDKEKESILDSYRILYDKYKVLDSTTCERLLHALCVIDEWKKALKVLDDIHLSSKPSHSAYSTLIATFFRLNKKSDALKLIERSINAGRPLKHIAYVGWIDYILRKYKEKNTILKYLDEICLHISKNCEVITMKTAEKFKTTYLSLGWNAHYTKIRKKNGQCMCCNGSLECLRLSEEEFCILQQNVKDKLVIGSDLFLKSSPDEFKRFQNFIEETAPYDIVIDALNVAYALGLKGSSSERVQLVKHVVDHFRNQDKKILLLGRKHMLNWPKMRYLLKDISSFFTENLSQDDPYIITAAILSGLHTDIVSKDLLRGHKFNLQDKQLQALFQRWQWQRQWMVFINRGKEHVLQPPLSITPCAQKNNGGWHLPYEKEDASTAGQVKDGTPDWSSWLCLAPDR